MEVVVEGEVGKPNKRKQKQNQQWNRNGTPRLLRIVLKYNLAS